MSNQTSRHKHVVDQDWMPRAARLAEEVTAAAAMNDPAWRSVIAAVPRHVVLDARRLQPRGTASPAPAAHHDSA
jgi:hypothetical protein